MTDDSRPAPAAAATVQSPQASAASARASSRSRWPLFAVLALGVVIVDQLAKAAVTRSLAPGQSVAVVGDLVRIVFGENTGALFGLFKDNALMFGVVSVVVVGLIVLYHARAAGSLYLTITLGLLLGGAIGNMVDRLLRGFVVDFVDVGIGTTRFYTFNIADSAISLAILLLFVGAIRPSLVEGAGAGAGGPGAGGERSTAMPPAGPADARPPDPDDDWGDGLHADDRTRPPETRGPRAGTDGPR